MAKLRLFVALGPQGVFNAITALRYMREMEDAGAFEDWLLLGPFYAPSEESHRLRVQCRLWAKLWPFEAILEMDELVGLAAKGRIGFRIAVILLRSMTQGRLVDSIFVAFNGLLPHEVALHAFPDARHVCFGGGTGWLMLDDSCGVSCGFGNQFPRIDEAYLTTPVEVKAGDRDRVTSKVMPVRFYSSVVADACGLGLQAGILPDRVPDDGPSGGAALVLLANFTEAGIARDEDAEIEMYEAILSPHRKEGELLLIKRHPRQPLSRAQRLSERLRKIGFCSTILTGNCDVPVEILVRQRPVQRIFGIYSTGSVMAAFANPCPVLIGLGEKLEERFLKKRLPRGWSRGLRLLCQQAVAGKFEWLGSAELLPSGEPDEDAAVFVSPQNRCESCH